MSSTQVNWAETFPNGDLVSNATGDQTLVVAWDAEWQSKYTTNRNLLLSQQIAGINLATGDYLMEIIYPDHNFEVRYTLFEIFELIFNMFGLTDEMIDGYHLILICHFCTAEWSTLRDRKEIAYHFEFLYKTLLTFKAKKITFTTRNGVAVTITFELAETMVLLPPSHRSLDKAAALLLGEAFRKKDLSSEEKSNMLTLLKTDKKRFEAYALHDADITLRVLIKLQFILNKINGMTSKRYATIGTATVNHFEKFFKKEFGNDEFKSQFARNNLLYMKYLDLARRAYLGGINNAYFLGEVKGRVFLDVDFSAAYPVVMSMLNFSYFGEKVDFEKEQESRNKEFVNDGTI